MGGLVLYGDSVELDTSEVKEYVVDSSIPAPSNVASKSITWDPITFAWNDVEEASFYQIKSDGNKCWSASAANTFTKLGLLTDTKHSVRLHIVKRIMVKTQTIT